MNTRILIATRDRATLAGTEAVRRCLVRTTVEELGPRLLLFNVDRANVEAVIRGDGAPHAAAHLRSAIRRVVPDVTLERPHLTPVTTLAHLEWCVQSVLTHTDHVTSKHPALWTGSCFLDLVGARVVPGFDVRPLWDELPRALGGDLFQVVGLPPFPLHPATDLELAAAGPERLVALAGATLAVGPELVGLSQPVVEARALAAHAGRAAGASSATMARVLQVEPRSVRKLFDRPIDPHALMALRRRLALEERVRRSGAA